MTHDTMSFIGQTRSNAVANVLKIGHCRKRIVFSSRLVNYTLVNDNGRLAIFSENDGLRKNMIVILWKNLVTPWSEMEMGLAFTWKKLSVSYEAPFEFGQWREKNWWLFGRSGIKLHLTIVRTKFIYSSKKIVSFRSERHVDACWFRVIRVQVSFFEYLSVTWSKMLAIQVFPSDHTTVRAPSRLIPDAGNRFGGLYPGINSDTTEIKRSVLTYQSTIFVKTLFYNFAFKV